MPGNRVTITSQLPAEVVQQRLDERSREWRESRVPPALRQSGVFGIRIRRSGSHFEMRTEGMAPPLSMFRRPVYWVRLTGEIVAQKDSTTLIRVRFRPALLLVYAIPFWIVGSAFWAWWSGGIAAYGLAAVFVLLPLLVHHLLGEKERNGLLQRLREIVSPETHSRTDGNLGVAQSERAV